MDLPPATRPRGVTPVSRYSLSQKPDSLLLRDASALVARACDITADLLAHLAEIDARKLYLPLAYPSMYTYCVNHLHLSEDAAYKRIQAARLARRFPAIFEAVAKGQLHLTAVGLLAPYLTAANAADLLAAAARKTKAEIEDLLARRFPRTDSMALIQALPASTPQANEQLAPAQVEAPRLAAPASQLAPAQVDPPAKLAPVAPERYLLQLTIGRGAQDRTCARCPDPAARASEVRRHFTATPKRAPQHEPATHSGPRQARGLGAGRWAMHFRERGRTPLPREEVPGV
jgi:hypothetical protein